MFFWNRMSKQEKLQSLMNDLKSFIDDLENILKGYIYNKSNENLIKTIIETEEDKQKFLYFLTIERFFFTLHRAETLCQKDSKIILDAMHFILSDYDQRTLKLFDIMLATIGILDAYMSNRWNYYQRHFELMFEETYGMTKAMQMSYRDFWVLQGSLISLVFAEENFINYKKTQTFTQYINLPDRIPLVPIIKMQESLNILNREKQLYEKLNKYLK